MDIFVFECPADIVLTYHFRSGEGVINKPRYRDAGVDIDAGAALVDAIKPLAASTARKGTVSGLGGFGALFDPKAAGFKDPVLVSGTDGVGTKLKVAIAADKHDTVGIDLVAMCVNDIVVQGAEPLFFLDYFATGKLDVARAQDVVAGIAEGCRIAGCALIGGETAELPGMYSDGDYDLAGFAVGAVERGDILTGDAIRAGDTVLGLASSGLHSNGFSLVRHIAERTGLDYAAPAPFADGTLAEALLTPTRIYVGPCLAAHRAGLVKGLAHITGGGLVENVARILPDGLAVHIGADTWTLPPVFGWLRRDGGVADEEMLRTFNCGIGMVVVCAADAVTRAEEILRDAGETVRRLGEVVERGDGPPVSVIGTKDAWRA